MDTDITDEDILSVPDLRHLLEAHPSPFVGDDYHGGGFVQDDDLIYLKAARFASRRHHVQPPPPSPPPQQTFSSDTTDIVNTTTTRDQQPHDSTSNDNQHFQGKSFATAAGPRSTIYFQPRHVRCMIVTSGQTCPGINDIIRGLVLKLLDYGVLGENILGCQMGWRGFTEKKYRPIALDREAVASIHLEGGSFLGTSCKAGSVNVGEVLKRLDLWSIDMLFVLGGLGSHAAAQEIQQQCTRSKVPCCVVCIPKAVDNDIGVIDRCFGFESATEEAQRAILAAKVEAASAYHGIGVCKLFGKRSGFIAVQASLASGLVDVCLIPESPFDIDKVLAHVEHVLERQGHCVVCVAEGAQQKSRQSFEETYDSSGLALTEDDVGCWLKRQFKTRLEQVDVKYIDPSYIIRSVSTNSNDRVYCRMLAHGAVHAAFAGFTDVTVGLVNTHFVYLPISTMCDAVRIVDPRGELWNRLRSAIGQPNF